MHESILQAILLTYLQPLEKIIERRAAWYLTLSEKDPFSMSPDEASRHQRRLTDIAEEIEILDAVRHSIDDLGSLYVEKIAALENTLAVAKREHTELMKNHSMLSMMCQTDYDTIALFHNIILSRRT